MKILILTSEDSHHGYLILQLKNSFEDVFAIRESGSLARRKRLRASQWYHYLMAMYHYFRRRILGLHNYRSRFFRITNNETLVVRSCSFSCESINTPAVREVIANYAHDLTVVCGTTVLDKTTLGVLGTHIINIHGGFLPKYGGNHCFFFAMWNKDWKHLGSSIHHVTSTIDTGDLIEQFPVSAAATDIPETLYCRADYAAIHGLVNILKTLNSADQLPRRPQEYKGKLYMTCDRTPWKDLLFWIRDLRRFPWGWGRTCIRTTNVT